jgi:GT2 family glycosyltransferase
MGTERTIPGIAVVIPVHNNGDDFHACLNAILSCRPPPTEVVAVDDGGTDGSASFAESKGITVIRLDCAHGPAFARNRGVETTTADVVLFVDADVVVPPDTVGKVAGYLHEHDRVAAVFGSYDEDPPAGGILSKYRNLLHHWIHQHADEEASTFWAGCGAIRKTAFDDVNGFNETYVRPSIEDVELGLRLRAAGHRIRLLRDLQCCHLKQWTVWSTIRTDIFCRAVPWSRLSLQCGLPRDLNFRWRDRIGAGLACLLPVLLAGALLTPWLWPAALIAAGGLIALNTGFYRFLLSTLGPGALICIPWHWSYLAYSAATFGLVRMFGSAKPRPRTDRDGRKRDNPVLME